MDSIDRHLVLLLRTNGRLSQEQLAREVNLSRSAVHERLKRLEERRVIRGYTAVIDWEAWGQPLTAFIWLRTSGATCNAIRETMMGLSDSESTIEESHRLTGDWCLLLKAHTTSPLALQRLLDRIREVPGVQNTMTSLVLSTLSPFTVVDQPPASL
jgi:Lrp/AsnC family leucine-responsive transcriptional regulator